MKISTKGRYGLKVVVDLALAEASPNNCVNLKSIAIRHGLSENYLEQLVAPLKKAGLVESVRGAQGGYFLKKPSQNITVGEVLRVLEGPLAPVECLIVEDAACGNTRCDDCLTKPVWDKIYKGLNNVVDSITISDLIIKDEH